MTEHITVELVYAEPMQFWQQMLRLPAGSCVGDALAQHDKNAFPAAMHIHLEHLAIFGQKIKVSEVLNNHDRIEILRPLIHDPKDNRRQRAALNPLKKTK